MTDEETRAYDRSQSKVEVRGFEARHYDRLIDIVTLGTYPSFIRRAIGGMGIRPGDAILDLGSGTGRNAELMARRLSGEGRIVGLDIGPEMLAQAQSRFRDRAKPDILFEQRRIDEPLPYRNEFDKALISFVLHGFVQEDRLRIIENVRLALKPGGVFFILDYAHFEPEEASRPVRWIFRYAECPLAADFARRDWEDILSRQGFGDFSSRLFYKGYVRLLKASREQDQQR